MNNFHSLVKRQLKAKVAQDVVSLFMPLNKCTPRMEHGTKDAFHAPTAIDLL